MENIKILENKEFNGIEIYFNEKPNQNIITELKNNHFKWHTAKKCWYAKATEQNKILSQSIANGTPIETITENNGENDTHKAEQPTSELKYLLNGIKDKDGKYYKCFYFFDNTTLEIEINHEDYGELPIPTDTTGISYKDDTDYYTDYFDKPTLKIAPTSTEYLSALNNLKRVIEKNKNFSFNITGENLKQIETILNAEDKQETYNSILKHNKEKKAEEEHQRYIEENKNDIINLQETKKKIENGEYSYYDRVIETESTITAISHNTYSIIDFTPNCLDKKTTEYFARTINKKDYSVIRKNTTDKEEFEEYISNLA